MTDDAKANIIDQKTGLLQTVPIVAAWGRDSVTGYYVPVDINVFRSIDTSLQTLASEATLQEVLLELQGAGKNYKSVKEVISVDTDYVIPFSGQNLIFYADKSITLRLNDASKDAIELRANIGVKIDNFELTKILLTNVQASTTVEFIVTGN